MSAQSCLNTVSGKTLTLCKHCKKPTFLPSQEGILSSLCLQPAVVNLMLLGFHKSLSRELCSHYSLYLVPKPGRKSGLFVGTSIPVPNFYLLGRGHLGTSVPLTLVSVASAAPGLAGCSDLFLFLPPFLPFIFPIKSGRGSLCFLSLLNYSTGLKQRSWEDCLPLVSDQQQ